MSEELREQVATSGRSMAASQMECDIAEILHTHPDVTWSGALDLADALLSGPLAPLLAAQAALERVEIAVERVEALADIYVNAAEHAPRTATYTVAKALRAALDGPT